MGLTLPQFRSLIATDLKVTVDTEVSTAELNRAVQRAVDDLSRYFPLELVHEETLSFTITDESITTPAAASATAIVNAADISATTSGGVLTIADATPDVPRRLTVTLTDANASITALTVIVKGYDQNGCYVEESFYLKDLPTGTAYQGNTYFKYIEQIEVDNIAGNGTSDTLSVGTGNAYDSYIFMANKPIRPETEVVTDAAGTTTYTRDTDYAIDYSNGAIRFINGGSMAAGTAYLVDYTKSRLGLNISSLLPVVTRITKVQYPVDLVPQQFVSFNIVGDFMYVASKIAGQSQEEFTTSGADHLAIWYERNHMPPGEGSPGSYPAILDEVIAIGAAAYALLIEAQQYEQQAVTDLASVRTALTNLKKYLDNNSDADAAGILQDITDEAANLRTAIDTAVDAANTYLDDVDTTDLGKATVGAEAYTETGDDLIDTVNVGARVPENYADYSRARANIAAARTSAAMGYIREAETRLANLQTYIQQASGYNSIAGGFATEASNYSQVAGTDLALADRFRAEGLERLLLFNQILKNKAEARRRTTSTPTKQPA